MRMGMVVSTVGMGGRTVSVGTMTVGMMRDGSRVEVVMGLMLGRDTDTDSHIDSDAYIVSMVMGLYPLD